MTEKGTPESVPRTFENEFGGSVLEDAGGRSDNIASLGERVSRYASAKSKATEIMAYGAENVETLKQIGGHTVFKEKSTGLAMPKALARLSACGNYLTFRHYLHQDSVRLHHADFCKQALLCPLCAVRRSARNVAAYSKVLQALDMLDGPGNVDQLLTLTIKNGDDLDERDRHLRKSISKLNMRRKDHKRGKIVSEWGIITGAVGAFEATNKGKGWHPHAHIWVRAPRLLDQDALSAEWKAITGDSHIVDVRAITGDPIAAFCEVFKYAVKFSDLTPAQVWEFWGVNRGRRMIFSYGAFRAVEVPESLTDEELTGPYVEHFYRWAGVEVGYTRSASPPPPSSFSA